jgi:hypothetical protein
VHFDNVTPRRSAAIDFAFHFANSDETCSQKLSAVILANNKDVTALLQVVNVVQNICLGQISFDDYNVVDRCIDELEHLFADPCVEFLTEADTLLEKWLWLILVCFWIPALPAQCLPNSSYQRPFAQH